MSTAAKQASPAQHNENSVEPIVRSGANEVTSPSASGPPNGVGFNNHDQEEKDKLSLNPSNGKIGENGKHSSSSVKHEPEPTSKDDLDWRHQVAEKAAKDRQSCRASHGGQTNGPSNTNAELDRLEVMAAKLAKLEDSKQVELMEARIAKLEAQLAEASKEKGEPDEVKADTDKSGDSSPVEAETDKDEKKVDEEEKPKIDWSSPNTTDDPTPCMSWDDLKAFYHVELNSEVLEVEWGDFIKTDPTSLSALEVPRGDFATWKRNAPRSRVDLKRQQVSAPKRKFSTVSLDDESTNASLRAGDTWFHGVKINSSPVVEKIQSITKLTLNQNVILAPYKELLYFEDEIRQAVKDLEAESLIEVDTGLLPFQSKEASEKDAKENDESSGTAAEPADVKEFKASDEFHQLKKKAKASAILPQFQLLIKFMDIELREVKSRRLKIKAGDFNEIDFRDVWMLFEPGSIIVSEEGGNSQAWRVLQCYGGHFLHDSKGRDDYSSGAGFAMRRSTQTTYSRIYVDCYRADFNGVRFGPVVRAFFIDEFKGTRALSGLPIRPLDHAKPVSAGLGKGVDEDIKDYLLNRGNRFCDLVAKDKVVHKHYQDRTLDLIPEYIESDIVIDMERAADRHLDRFPQDLEINEESLLTRVPPRSVRIFKQTCSIADCTSDSCYAFEPVELGDGTVDSTYAQKCFKDNLRQENQILHDEDITDGHSLSDDDKRLLPHKLWAYVLQDRKWACVHVECIKDIPYRKDSFKNLELPPGHKRLLQLLVKHHITEKRNEIKKKGLSISRGLDPIKGKGKGLVILLHGSPGVGKTSTAECMAGYTQLPLLPITCGDLGEEASEVDTNLTSIFQMAHKWNCIMLLDEADVFLAKRDKSDIKRNALHLDEGILFLTTNRVGVFDEAFKSRIRISLYYPPLGREETANVWQRQIDMIREHVGRENVDIDDSALRDFARQHWDEHQMEEDSEFPSGQWNGRQIRNAFQTAVALASWDKNGNRIQPLELTTDHFQAVVNAADDFDQYVKATHDGESDQHRAKQVRERDDNWRTKRPAAASKAKSASSLNDLYGPRKKSNEEGTPTRTAANGSDANTPTEKADDEEEMREFYKAWKAQRKQKT